LPQSGGGQAGSAGAFADEVSVDAAEAFAAPESFVFDAAAGAGCAVFTGAVAGTAF
jgi:NADPH:quinone reductase-like Zn-dependent oxidoreductase